MAGLPDPPGSFFALNGASVGASTEGAVAEIVFVIDGGGLVITTGLKGFVEVPFNCVITEAALFADQAGSIVVDVWRCGYSAFDGGVTHPASSDKITASAPPTLSGAAKGRDQTLTGWTKMLSAGDVLGFNVNSVSTVLRTTLTLRVTKS